jgi:hypothetical protein
MAEAWLVVRAVVANPADRAAFDRWYRLEHLPDAVKAFSVTAAWRAWSVRDPSVHCAFYRFDSLDVLEKVIAGPEITGLIAEFDRCWHDRVTRMREVLTVPDDSDERNNA